MLSMERLDIKKKTKNINYKHLKSDKIKVAKYRGNSNKTCLLPIRELK